MSKISPNPEPGRLPDQDQDRIILMADRFDRSAAAHNIWAEKAKENVDFLEGRQWTATQISELESQGRPALVFNKIAPLVRLLIGYHRNNRTDIKFFPSGEGLANEDVGEALTRLEKHIHEQNSISFVDTEVFLDGIVAGRGYFDDRINFEENIHGEILSRAVDPFSVYIDPDADSYDLDETANYIQTTRWVSIDEVEVSFGKPAAELLNPFFTGNAWTTFPQLNATVESEVTPIRSFGLEDDITAPAHERFRSVFHEQFIDDYRKNIRLLDSQYYLSVTANVFIDLETGQQKRIPDHWAPERIQKVLFFAEQSGNPMVVQRRKVRRIRWTVVVGDIMVFDDWSPYESFTIRGYFPYFRRGITRGMVDDLKDPQKEVNKRRSAEIEIVGRTANSGWIMEDGALDTDQERQLEMFGNRPGIIIKKKQGASLDKIDPSPPPTAMERLEEKSRNDIKEIGGVNEAALGELDKVTSGRALEARQRQAVIGFQMYVDNFSRTKELQGRKHLDLVQNFYTEERLFRVLGEDGKRTELFINRRTIDPVSGAGRILNDITIGKYAVSIDETPMAASFQNAQFEEALLIIEKLGPVGQALLASRPDLLVEMSSLPRKEEWSEALKEALGLAAAAPPAGPGGPQGGVPVPAGPAQPDALGGAQNVVPLIQGGG